MFTSTNEWESQADKEWTNDKMMKIMVMTKIMMMMMMMVIIAIKIIMLLKK